MHLPIFPGSKAVTALISIAKNFTQYFASSAVLSTVNRPSQLLNRSKPILSAEFRNAKIITSHLAGFKTGICHGRDGILTLVSDSGGSDLPLDKLWLITG